MAISSTRSATILAAGAVIALSSPAAARPDFCEGVDAGSQPFSATSVTG